VAAFEDRVLGSSPIAAKSPVFTRVLRNLPHFTISLSRSIVNGFYRVSTGFFPVSSVFVRFPSKTRHLWAFSENRNAIRARFAVRRSSYAFPHRGHPQTATEAVIPAPLTTIKQSL
jgi:hypothetical protein